MNERPEIRLNEDGTLDEVVGRALVHLEQMDGNHWWMGLDYPGGRVTVNFHARGKITANVENERDATPAVMAAAPSEREAFEKWFDSLAKDDRPDRPDSWFAWQARATLSTESPAPAAPSAEPTDWAARPWASDGFRSMAYDAAHAWAPGSNEHRNGFMAGVKWSSQFFDLLAADNAKLHTAAQREIAATLAPSAEPAHKHEWNIWPEPDGLEQKCAICGAYRATPEADKFWKSATPAVAPAAAPQEAPSEWRALLEAVMREMPERSHRSDRGNAPGHGHRIPGVWDEDNGRLAGKPCAWCLVWNTAVAALASPTEKAEPSRGRDDAIAQAVKECIDRGWYGVNPPPSGHWLNEFWDYGRALATEKP